jgi:hypothetical protein
MLSIKEIEAFYQDIPPEFLEIVLEIRNLICTVSPTTDEMIQWKGLSYFDSSRGGTISAGICQIFVAADHVRLAFVHGAFLPDPHQLLEGNAQYKRFVSIRSFNEAPWDALKELIQASSRFDPRTHTMH